MQVSRGPCNRSRWPERPPGGVAPSGRSEPDRVQPLWISNPCFNIYRSVSATEPDIRLNDALIPSQAPGSGQDASYQWQDFAVDAGVTYYYWLETVALNGSTEIHGPVSATFAGPTAVALGTMDAGPMPVGTTLPASAVILALLLPLLGALSLRRRTVFARE